MKQLLIAGLLACVTLTSRAQTSETRYYKSMSMDEEVPQEKAKYSKTITTNADGSITTERKNLKKNLIESRQVLKGDEPVGIWVYLTGRGPAEMNYDFTVEYSDQECPKNLNIKNYFIDDLSIQYESPKLSTGEQFYEFVGKNLVYPAKARRENIQGKVDLTFDLTKDGVIENIRVKKGVHIVLDKEAVRILKKIKLSSPPKINGQPQTLCASTSISFRLG
jgi:TonB family protein